MTTYKLHIVPKEIVTEQMKNGKWFADYMFVIHDEIWRGTLEDGIKDWLDKRYSINLQECTTSEDDKVLTLKELRDELINLDLYFKPNPNDYREIVPVLLGEIRLNDSHELIIDEKFVGDSKDTKVAFFHIRVSRYHKRSLHLQRQLLRDMESRGVSCREAISEVPYIIFKAIPELKDQCHISVTHNNGLYLIYGKEYLTYNCDLEGYYHFR